MNIKTILSNIYKEYLEITSDDTLTVDSIYTHDEECIYVNRVNKELYCLELIGSSNIQNSITKETLQNIYDNYRYFDLNITEVFLKNKEFQKNYVFSSDKEILKMIKNDTGGVILKNYEIIKAIFYLFMDTTFYFKDGVLKEDFDITSKIKYENITNTFNKMVKNSVYKNLSNYDVYQGINFKKRAMHYEQYKLFNIDWTGVIYVDLFFSSDVVNAVIKQRKTQAYFEAKQNIFEDLGEKYKNNEINLIVLNSIAVIENKKDKNLSNLMSQVGNALNISFKQKEIFKDKLLKFTPLKKRDIDWDMITELEWLNGFIANNHKMNFTEEKDAMFYGFDINKAFVNFNFSKTTPIKNNKNSDFLLLGVKGSGKTTTTNAIMSQIVGIDVKTKDYNPKNLKKGWVEARIFDIKNSSRALYELIKHDKDVGFIDTSLEYFSYNPLNIPYKIKNNNIILNENILEMNILLLSMTLEVKSKSNNAGFTNTEQTIIRETIHSIYKEMLDNKDFNTVAIQTLEETHEEIYKKIIGLGYDDTQRVSEIKESEFDFLKLPTFDILISKVSLLQHSDKDKVKKEASRTLLSKLKDIESIRIFNGFDKVDVSMIKYLYMNFDPIKDIPEFVPIFLGMATKLFLFDKNKQRGREAKGIERPYIIYLFEEAVNLFKQPSFESFLIKFNNEARSDRIVAGYVAQVIEQVPKYIFDQVENKLLLFPSEGKRNQIIDSITKATNPPEDIKDVFRRVGEFEMCYWNEHGATVVNLGLTKEEIDIYGQDK